MGFAKGRLIGLRTMDVSDVERVLDTAEVMRDVFGRQVKKLPTLRGKVLVNLFYEPSTRTRTSFEMAGKGLGADVVNMSADASSVVKGESLTDTAQTLAALGADVVVVRHPTAGAPARIARLVDAAVVNAGDGMHEHPTQGLLDLFTVRRAKGDVAGLHVVIVGDVLHSRVARSNVWGFLALGARLTVVGPPPLLPPGLERMGVAVAHDLDAVLPEADVVNVLRLQRERQGRSMFPSLREYRRVFGLTGARLEKMRDDALLLHPGPANVGVEIDRDAVDDPRSRIHEQVTNGVAVRMAALYLLTGGRADGVGA